MAFLFALIFAAIGFGVSFLYGRFLDVDGNTAADNSSSDAVKKGQVIDVVIRDDDLPSDEVTGQYTVGSSHQLLTPEDVNDSGSGFGMQTPQAAYQRQTSARPSDKGGSGSSGVDEIKSANQAAASSSQDGKFVPVRNLETLYNVSGKEAVSASAGTVEKEIPAAVHSDESGEQKYSAADEDLDTLPSMGDLDIDTTSSYSGDGINNESDFATSGVSHKAEEPEIKDAPLMAKAISTLLANESKS